MTVLLARDMMHSGQFYKVRLLAQNALDDPRLLASINDEGNCTAQPLAELFVTSVSDQFFDTEETGGAWQTTFAVRCNRSISVGEYMLFIGRCANQLTTVFHGEISDANTAAGHIAAVPGNLVNLAANAVKGTAKAIGDIPQWLALTAGLVLAAILVVKFKS